MRTRFILSDRSAPSTRGNQTELPLQLNRIFKVNTNLMNIRNLFNADSNFVEYLHTDGISHSL